MNALEQILKLMPRHIADSITELDVIPEEIRLRRGQAVVIRAARQEYLCKCPSVTQADMIFLMTNATNGAYHKVRAFMEQGYLPLPGGCRLGISGEGSAGEIRSVRNIHSVCIRMAGEVFGCADSVLPYICTPDYHNTIIIAPPGNGKTTLLREIIRKLSMGGRYIAAVDERGEISGLRNGQPAFDLGPRCDVTVGLSKGKAAVMMLRSMCPDILAMDEITAFSDMDAILEAVGCGVGLLTTIHGSSLAALEKPGFREILNTNAFEKAVIIQIKRGLRQYQVVNIHD